MRMFALWYKIFIRHSQQFADLALAQIPPTTMKFARQNWDAILVIEIVVFGRFYFPVVRDIV